MTWGPSGSRRDDVLARILDAAVTCILERGWRSTSLTDVAQRAGMSRPTVYKHVGDKDAVAAALREREFARYSAGLATVLTHYAQPRQWFGESLIYTVRHARRHALFQRLLAQEPELVLPWLTRDAAPVLSLLVSLFEPPLERAVRNREVRRLDPGVAAEWTGRLAISLVLTPSVTIDLDDSEALRAFVDALFALGLEPRGER